MWKISLINSDQSLEVQPPQVVDTITIDLYDDSKKMVLKDNTTGDTILTTEVAYNEKNICGLLEETGKFTIEIHTSSGGTYTREIEIASLSTTIIFNKIDYDFEVRRVNEQNEEIIDSGTDLVSTSFVSTDEIRLQVRELGPSNLSDDGFSSDAILWSAEGVTPNDGTVDVQASDDNTLYRFIPRPINRPLQRPVRTRNLPIRYTVSATIMGLKKEFALMQDQIDILRQEYIDFGTRFQPQRSNAYLDNGSWNVGNYDYIVTESDGNHFQTIYDEIVSNWQDKGYTDGIIVSSAYRNPRRNPGVLNSRHLRGLALDIYPAGAITLQRWLDLRASGNEVIIDGLFITAHCDRSGTFVDHDCSLANHIHVQWENRA